MSEHIRLTIHTWVTPAGTVQYTLTSCDDCKTFKVEGYYPDGENHGDVRYLDPNLQPGPHVTPCPALR